MKWCAKLVRMHDSVDKIKQKLYGTAWKQGWYSYNRIGPLVILFHKIMQKGNEARKPTMHGSALGNMKHIDGDLSG